MVQWVVRSEAGSGEVGAAWVGYGEAYVGYGEAYVGYGEAFWCLGGVREFILVLEFGIL